MNATAMATARSHTRLWATTLLTALALLALWFISKRALPYFNVSEAHFGPYFWPRRWELVIHVAGGVVALAAGVMQLWLGLTNRVASLHRALGRLYVGVIGVGSLAGFHLASTIPGNLPYASGLFSLCVAWVVTTAMAVIAIRRRDVPRHRDWMIRSYAVTFAFVTFRIGVDLMTSRGVSPGDAQAVMAWACWAVPMLLLEPLLQLRHTRARLTSA